MRNIVLLATLSVVATSILTGGAASANTGHREPVRTVHRIEANRVVDHRELARPIVRDHREVEIRGRAFDAHRFEGMRYEHGRYVRETIGARYFDINVRPAPLFEDLGVVQDGYIWVTGNWQWNGAEWIWVAGHYQAAY